MPTVLCVALGLVAQLGERPCRMRKVASSKLVGSTGRVWCNGSITVSKTVGGGSIPPTRAKHSCVAVWCSSLFV